LIEKMKKLMIEKPLPKSDLSIDIEID